MYWPRHLTVRISDLQSEHGGSNPLGASEKEKEVSDNIIKTRNRIISDFIIRELEEQDARIDKETTNDMLGILFNMEFLEEDDTPEACVGEAIDELKELLVSLKDRRRSVQVNEYFVGLYKGYSAFLCSPHSLEKEEDEGYFEEEGDPKGAVLHTWSDGLDAFCYLTMRGSEVVDVEFEVPIATLEVELEDGTRKLYDQV